MSASLDRFEISLLSSSSPPESSKHTLPFSLLFNSDRALPPLATLRIDDSSYHELFLLIAPHLDRREPLVLHIAFYSFSYCPRYVLQPRHGTNRHSQYLHNFFSSSSPGVVNTLVSLSH